MLEEYAQSPKITIDELPIIKLLCNVTLVVFDCDNMIAVCNADSAVFATNVRQLNELLPQKIKQTRH
ncbi:hypothetical protein SARC_10341, partial [Sphaeroforma arctica JP610]